MVHLHFTDFDIEFHTECSYDSVKIYDGASPSARLLGTYCGSDTPGYITFAGNMLFVIFTSDSLKRSDGFKVMYNAKGK